MPLRLILTAIALLPVLLLVGVLDKPQGVVATPGDVAISALSCDSSPEYVSIHNYGSASESLSGFRVQSDPSQDYDLSAHVASIGAGQTLEFQSGTGAANNPGASVYKLTGSNIYRNGDATDYARLVRSDSSTQQVNCGSTPATPTSGATQAVTPTPTGSGVACGEERWSVKTLSDPDAGQVNFNPQDTTVDALRLLTRPDSLPPDNRIPPTEETTFRLTAQVEKMKLEDDHDIHLVIADLSDASHTMIVEFPDVACDGAAQSSHKAEMLEARQEFTGLFGQPSVSQFTDISGIVVITGVGFFDFLHGQTGVAPNGIELHPALSVRLNTTFTPTASPTHSPTPTPLPTASLGGIPVAPGTPGDYDCDNVITTSDAGRLLAELAGTPYPALGRPCSIPTGVNPGDRGDPTCDGVVDARDVLAILLIVVQLRVPAYC